METELAMVNGGAVKWGILGLIGGVVTFVVGLVDGLLRPLKCN